VSGYHKAKELRVHVAKACALKIKLGQMPEHCELAALAAQFIEDRELMKKLRRLVAQDVIKDQQEQMQ
jgi:hypothetical protein